ncbi:MAG: hypothetical protein U5L75_01365 [Candidatus Campbellbacteria bacterium]|nr:hypothetical protein [Candidatus Campbellbacteria bacterium]
MNNNKDYFKDKKITVMGLGVAWLLENPRFSTFRFATLLSDAGKQMFSRPLS